MALTNTRLKTHGDSNTQVAIPQGFVVWLTGLPSSGKTTIAAALASALREQGIMVEILDGDELRQSLSADLGFSADDRREQIRRVTYIAKLLIRNGIVVIVPLISPYREARQIARTELQRFIEVYVKCSLEECTRRDVKGLYAKAVKGEISEFTGVSAPYEEPEHPESVVETDILSVHECCQRILSAPPLPSYINNGKNPFGTLDGCSTGI